MHESRSRCYHAAISPSGPTVSSNPFEIGRGQGADYFHGSIDEVQFTPGRELSNAEITQDYDDGGGSIHNYETGRQSVTTSTHTLRSVKVFATNMS